MASVPTQDANYFRFVFYDGPVMHAGPGSHKTFRVFDELFHERFVALSDLLKADLQPDGLLLRPAVFAAFSRSLQGRLKRLIGPVFLAIYESYLEQALATGELTAPLTAAQELAFRRKFIATMHHQGIAELFAKHSYLEQLTRQIITDWQEDTHTFLQRLAEDLDDIYQAVGWSFAHGGRVVNKLRGDLSDMHAGGTTVKIIEVPAGTFVYKPRSLGSETAFYALLCDWNRQGLQPNLYTPWVIDKGTHGWMEYCRPISKSTQGPSIKQNGQQFGALSALWHLLGGTDLHRDNILFTHKGVVIADCETIFEIDFHCAALRQNGQRRQGVQAADSHSILSTHAFTPYLVSPVSKRGRRKDIAGVARYREVIDRAAPHKSADFQEFVQATVKSVEKTLRFFRQSPADLTIATVQNRFAAPIHGRVIIRATRVYAVLRHNLIHSFSVLEGPAKATAYLDKQLDLVPAAHQGLIDEQSLKQAEVAQLLRLDIPYIARIVGQNQLQIAPGANSTHLKNIDFISLQQELLRLHEPQSIQKETRLIQQALLQPTTQK